MEAFQHRMFFVFGTGGTPEENAWSLAKARFDAESFWYGGNGSVDVVPDTAFGPGRERDRGVILYGHPDSKRGMATVARRKPDAGGQRRICLA